MGDEQVREPEPVLQVLEQVDDAGLDRHVERRHRLVEHDQRRVERQRAGDADALALAAGELVGEPLARGRAPGPTRSSSSRDPLGMIAGHLLDLQRLGDRAADGDPGIERRVRVLEDDLHLVAELPQLLAARSS